MAPGDIKSCKLCGSPFVQPPGKGMGRREKCPPGTGCGSPFNCKYCGEYVDKPHNGQMFCSSSCGRRWQNTQPGHQRAAGKRAGAKRASQLRAAARYDGEYEMVPQEKGRYLHGHRMVAEQILQRSLLRGEVVHHENLDKRDNNPSNLVVFKSQGAHARHHRLGHLGDPNCGCDCIRLGEVMPK